MPRGCVFEFQKKKQMLGKNPAENTYRNKVRGRGLNVNEPCELGANEESAFSHCDGCHAKNVMMFRKAAITHEHSKVLVIL